MTEQTDTPQIRWPTVLKLHGADELTYLQDTESWRRDPHLQATQLTAEDCLIDSTGRGFRIGTTGAFIASGRQFGLAEVLQLVRRHAAQDGACCVAKLDAPSIPEAIAMVQD